MQFIETLNADGKSVDTCLPVGGKLFLFKSARIRLKCNFDICGKFNFCLDTAQQRTETVCAEQAGRSSTNKDRLQGPALHERQVLLQITEQGCNVFRFRQPVRLLVGIEIAIRALPHTPGYVDVKAQWRQSHISFALTVYALDQDQPGMASAAAVAAAPARDG